MKRLFFLITFPVMLFCHAQEQDLPTPSANNKTLPAGSYVIAMDNDNQKAANGYFNLKAYGLVVYLLNNNVKLRWVIKSGKTKDGIDFSVSAARVTPTSAATANLDFRSGPFVIYNSDLSGVDALINAYNNSITTTGDKIKVFQTKTAVNIDERYNLTGFKPKALLLNNGGNFKLHRANMLLAGIDFGMNTAQTAATNWSTGVAADLVSGCYTFASEAHWDEKTPAKAQPVINDIRTFLSNGGNVLAQCAAVRTYENTGLFHSSGGLNASFENKFSGTLATIGYPNADLSYSQIQGPLEINKGGSLQNWQYTGTANNHGHEHTKGGAQVGAAVAKLRPSGMGGLLFYLGNHSFDKTDKTEVLNGIRMYLNAYLTPPASMAPVCNGRVTPLTLCNLGYKVWLDNNHNNKMENYEPGAPGLLVRLYEDTNGDNMPDGDGPIDSILTSVHGVVGFTNLADGKYILGVEIDPARYTMSAMPATTGLYPDNDIPDDNNGVYLTADGKEVRTMAITLKAGTEPTTDGDGADGNLTLNIALLEKVAGILPVTLMQFNGIGTVSKTTLNWKVTNENSMKQYVVERSVDGHGFTTVGAVASLNAGSIREYSLVDNNVNGAAVLYYRLRSESNDGKFAYSNIVTVRFGTSKNNITVYPNPARSYVVLNVQAAENTRGTVKFLNAAGQVALTQRITTVKGPNAITINDIGLLSKGIYHISVQLENGDVFTQSLSVNR